MPDAFFSSSKPRKRKRTESSNNAGSAKKIARKGPLTKNLQKGTPANGIVKKKAREDEELSDETDGEGGGIDDLDLRPDADADVEPSGDEDEEETPAEKRLRLAQLYLNNVKESLGMNRSSYTSNSTNPRF
jgi:ribosomal RNA-processing protein 9